MPRPCTQPGRGADALATEAAMASFLDTTVVQASCLDTSASQASSGEEMGLAMNSVSLALLLG